MQVCLSQSTVLKKFVDTLFAECIHTLAVHMQVTLVGLAGFVDCSNERISIMFFFSLASLDFDYSLKKLLQQII